MMQMRTIGLATAFAAGMAPFQCGKLPDYGERAPLGRHFATLPRAVATFRPPPIGQRLCSQAASRHARTPAAR
jgi:hypothetical protein